MERPQEDHAPVDDLFGSIRLDRLHVVPVRDDGHFVGVKVPLLTHQFPHVLRDDHDLRGGRHRPTLDTVDRPLDCPTEREVAVPRRRVSQIVHVKHVLSVAPELSNTTQCRVFELDCRVSLAREVLRAAHDQRRPYWLVKDARTRRRHRRYLDVSQSVW